MVEKYSRTKSWVQRAATYDDYIDSIVRIEQEDAIKEMVSRQAEMSKELQEAVVEVKNDPDIFVDSVHNMIVLCKMHHTSGNKGLHHVPFPDWILQKYPKGQFQFLI